MLVRVLYFMCFPLSFLVWVRLGVLYGIDYRSLSPASMVGRVIGTATLSYQGYSPDDPTHHIAIYQAICLTYKLIYKGHVFETITLTVYHISQFHTRCMFVSKIKNTGRG